MEELAVIRRVVFGYTNSYGICFSAEVELLDGRALIILPYDLTVDKIEREHISDLNNLVNTTCVVTAIDRSVQFASFK